MNEREAELKVICKLDDTNMSRDSLVAFVFGVVIGCPHLSPTDSCIVSELRKLDSNLDIFNTVSEMDIQELRKTYIKHLGCSMVRERK